MTAASCAGHEDNGIIDDNTPSKLFNLDLLIAKVGISSQYLRNFSRFELFSTSLIVLGRFALESCIS